MPNSKKSHPALVVGHRDLDGHAILVADHSRDVTLAGGVFDKIDAAGSELNLLAADELELGVTAEGDHILSARRHVPVGDAAGRRATKLGAGICEQLEDVVAAGSQTWPRSPRHGSGHRAQYRGGIIRGLCS